MSDLDPISIYLAGPIDLAMDGGKAWREGLAEVTGTGILLVSPAHAYFNTSMATAKAVDRMNRYLISGADGVVALVSGAGIGTCRDIEFARSLGKPVCICPELPQSLSAYDLLQAAGLEEALTVVAGEVMEGRDTPPGFILGLMGGP